MSNPTIPQDRVSRFLATLRRLGGQNARVLSGGLAVAALASVADPALLAAYPQLASLTALLGGNLLASQIDRMADATGEAALQQTLDRLLATLWPLQPAGNAVPATAGGKPERGA